MPEWEEFITGVSLPRPPKDGARRGVFGRMKEGLGKSRRSFSEQFRSLFVDRFEEETWEELEEALIRADCGIAATVKIVTALEEAVQGGGVQTRQDLTDRLVEVVSGLFPPAATLDVSARPTVILMVGVNGTGKTTTIGKLASRFNQFGLKTTLAAGDTFRAAATPQLQEWGRRAGAEVVCGQPGADPAAVAFSALEKGKAGGSDLVIVDTAGRLHTQTNLMEELKKIHRVIAKHTPGAPHETLLTIDATTGQNGLEQAKLFGEAVAVDGVVLTKLDGTAKGGIAIAIGHELGLPIKLIGLGEKIEDLRPFDPADFARALFEA